MDPLDPSYGVRHELLETHTRLENLGEPIQRLLSVLREDQRQCADMQLLSTVGVKELAMVYDMMEQGEDPQVVWKKLNCELQLKQAIQRCEDEQARRAEARWQQQKELDEHDRARLRANEEKDLVARQKQLQQQLAAAEREDAARKAKRELERESREEQQRRAENELARQQMQEEVRKQEERLRAEAEKDRQRKLDEARREQDKHSRALEKGARRSLPNSQSIDSMQPNNLSATATSAATAVHHVHPVMSSGPATTAAGPGGTTEEGDTDSQKKLQVERERRWRQGEVSALDAIMIKHRTKAKMDEERRRREDQEILLHQHFAVNTPVDHKWSYFDRNAKTWQGLDQQSENALEGAHRNGAARAEVRISGQPVTVLLQSMIAQTTVAHNQTGQDPTNVAIRRFLPGEHQPEAHRARGGITESGEADGGASLGESETPQFAVWGMVDPVSRKWEAYPPEISRVLEVKFQSGQPTADFDIINRTPFTVGVHSMVQVDALGCQRVVQRKTSKPTWEWFNGLSWVPFTERAEQLLETHFSVNQPLCTITDQSTGITIEVDLKECLFNDSQGAWYGCRRTLAPLAHQIAVATSMAAIPPPPPISPRATSPLRTQSPAPTHLSPSASAQTGLNRTATSPVPNSPFQSRGGNQGLPHSPSVPMVHSPMAPTMTQPQLSNLATSASHLNLPASPSMQRMAQSPQGRYPSPPPNAQHHQQYSMPPGHSPQVATQMSPQMAGHPGHSPQMAGHPGHSPQMAAQMSPQMAGHGYTSPQRQRFPSPPPQTTAGRFSSPIRSPSFVGNGDWGAQADWSASGNGYISPQRYQSPMQRYQSPMRYDAPGMQQSASPYAQAASPYNMPMNNMQWGGSPSFSPTAPGVWNGM
eukprot:TRINITY_DN36982_c0_g1_i1.p1 TRINITY_DN36982_c0_g1~~TRINITY_DN36982_c0_g1_i1.p1  ORF type:complete len:875 (-),score=58.01 TRINITY_DN36982_c0_g1_i1:82-2706(-)